MRFQWLLITFSSILLFCSPAKAGKLLSWQFESAENRLVFITDTGVQPKAKLLSDPTRLVIDLPGTSLGRETVKENYSGRIRSLRVGQFDEETARIVVELAPGYTIDPEEVKFRGISSNQWSVSLPSPRIAPRSSASNFEERTNEPQTISVAPQSSDPSSTLPPPRISDRSRIVETRPDIEPRSTTSSRIVETRPDIEPQPTNTPTTNNNPPTSDSPYIKPTRNGFFITVPGEKANRISPRSGDRSSVIFELDGTTLPADLAGQTVAVNQYGIESIEFTQTSAESAQMTLQLGSDSPDWNVSFSRISRGLILVPRSGFASSNTNRPRSVIPAASAATRTSIQKISLAENETELLITANRPVTAKTRIVRSGTYQITIDNAQLPAPDSFQGPSLTARSPISEVRVKEENDGVIITVETKLGVRIGQLNSVESQLVALPIQRRISPPPLSDRPLLPPNEPTRTVEVPQADKPTSPRPIPPRPVPKSKPVVIIDPGHGGKDPGTIGIGGLREKDIVLPISLDVTQRLREQGIEVRMTRDSDYFVSLKGRTEFANNTNAGLFVSIHANAINMSRPDVNGLETYYFRDGRRFAEVIHWNILNSVNIKNRGIRRARFYVLRHSSMPAVLVEVGFVTGAEDAPRLKNPTHRSQIADAIVRGIIQYIKQQGL